MLFFIFEPCHSMCKKYFRTLGIALCRVYNNKVCAGKYRMLASELIHKPIYNTCADDMRICSECTLASYAYRMLRYTRAMLHIESFFESLNTAHKRVHFYNPASFAYYGSIEWVQETSMHLKWLLVTKSLVWCRT